MKVPTAETLAPRWLTQRWTYRKPTTPRDSYLSTQSDGWYPNGIVGAIR